MAQTPSAHPAAEPPVQPSATPPVPGSIEELVALELDLPEAPPRGEGRMLDYPPHDLYGLALSGGGIRSATFNLGLLQGLHELRLLRAFDYLSTVSGGGYVGGFWTRWRQAELERRRAAGDETVEERPASAETERRRFPERPAGSALPEPAEVRHLREFSNFLAPRLGLFSFDTGRMLVALVSSIVPSLLATLSFLVLAMLVWAAVAWPVLGAVGVDLTGAAGWLEFAASVVALVALTAATMYGFERVWHSRREVAGGPDYVGASLLATAVAAGVWAAIAALAGPAGGVYPDGGMLAVRPAGPPRSWWLWLLAPCAAWAVAAGVLIAVRWTRSPWTTGFGERAVRTAFDRVQSRLYFLIAAWAVLVALWALGAEAYTWVHTTAFGVAAADGGTATLAGTLAAAVAVLTAIFAKVQQLLAREPNKPAGSSLLLRLRPYLPQLLAYAAVVLMVVGVVAAVIGAGRAGAAALGGLAAGAAAVSLLTLFFFNPQEVGLHPFYRSRIVRAYLGASNPDGRRTTEEHAGDDLRIDRIEKGGDPPFHLVCCAVNDTNPADPLENLHRGAVSGVLSRVGWSVGTHWAPWHEEHSFVPTLGAAVTAAGAAFNPLLGSRTAEFGPAVTFLMAAFNLRLGLWLPHPRRVRDADRPLRRFGTRWRDEMPIGYPFYRELFGLADANASHVHLSDGGHYENLGVYELIRRHCRVIVASDCGQDPDVVFDDLGNLVRRVREDFSVEIRIDLEPLKPGPDGLARQPMVAGDIFYPDGDTGVLLLFKPTLIGSEPPDILQYESRNDQFPHETTGDQFYDAAQWEAYRRLGQFAARTAFRTVSLGVDLEPSALHLRTAAAPALQAAAGSAAAVEAGGRLRPDERSAFGELFAKARREWLPKPEGFDERVSRVADRIAELDALLREPECEPVLRQVYREIDELDRQGASQVPVYGIIRDTTTPDAPTSYRLGDAAEPPADAPQEPNELALSLYLIRRALLVLEEVYQREDLERNGSHPLYLGITNYFARWAYAPVFRMWWPLLKTLYTQPFTRWVERQYSLDAARLRLAPTAELVASVEPGGAGFAMMCWQQAGNSWPPAHYEDPRLISYYLKMRYQDQQPYRVQAAQLVGSLVDAGGAGALVWRSPDFFVPPGLWGVGVGGGFLHALASGAVDRLDAGLLAVRVEASRARGLAAKRELANEMQLYRSTGFVEVEPDHGTLAHAGLALEIPAELAASSDLISHWMVRAVAGVGMVNVEC